MSRSSRHGSSPGSHRIGGQSAAATASRGSSNTGFKESVGPSGDRLEREADRIANTVARENGVGAGAAAWSAAATPADTIQRKCAGCAEEEEETIRRAPKDQSPMAGGGSGPAALAEPASTANAGAPAASKDRASAEPKSQAGPALLVEDEAEPANGQMRRAEFMDALRASACEAVDGALAGTGRDSQGCPYIDYWFGYYQERSASQIERSLRRYAPEAAKAASARDYIRVVTSRIRRSAEVYARTGKLVGLPDDMPGAGLAGGLLSAFGGMFFKARPGGARQADPVSVRDQLGSGEPLPGNVRTRMETAFGTGFGGVRVHTDSTGAELSDDLNARAFTVGRHVAFGRGEFRPGTVGGDALIAHELAHVVQQNGASDEGRARRANDNTAPLERDADRSAASVIQTLFDRTQRTAGRVRTQAAPALQSGLTLSRCGKSERQKEVERLGDVQYAFLEKRRKDEEEKAKKDAEDDAKKKGLPPPTVQPKVELSDITKKDEGQHALPANPTTEWDNVVDKPAWKKDAEAVIKSVEASVKGTEVEPLLKGVAIKFTPEEAFKGGFYASFQNSSNTFRVGMSWIKIAKKDPKNVWENIVHEAGGHRRYGTTYSSEIMDAALRNLSDKERKKVIGDDQKFFEAYSYPETEIYAALWQRRYQHPESGPVPETGGIDTDANIEKRLKVMRDALAPEVQRAVIMELKRRVDQNDQILARDKKFFADKVKEILKIDI